MPLCVSAHWGIALLGVDWRRRAWLCHRTPKKIKKAANPTSKDWLSAALMLWSTSVSALALTPRPWSRPHLGNNLPKPFTLLPLASMSVAEFLVRRWSSGPLLR